MTKVAVAMSGGVDSSVTAALMVEKYGAENVFGVTMRLFCYGEAEADEKACCSLEAINDAKRVCDQLGIAHYAINMEKEFEEAVIQNFVAEYRLGHTPIPCVICNTVIKFDYLLKKVQGMGADFLATGHYARVRPSQVLQGSDPSRYELLRGTDELKDQTYFLHGLTQEQLAHTLFPVGDIPKTETRKIAAKLKLKTAAKKESQGICFVVGERVTDYLRDKVEIKPGEIIDTKGNKVGEHDGVVFYTVGQRKRIGGGHAEPMYVIRVDAKKNQVVIGNEKDLYQKELSFVGATWVSGNQPAPPFKCTAKIRYNMDDAECVITNPSLRGAKGDAAISAEKDRHADARDDKIDVVFDEPQRAITPGQSVVFYDGDICLGGGIIS
jgi:tRNA-uridine 2-sulfurtransferase